MARGGVNKPMVKEARNKLMTMGKNVSLDAIRIELGNTGSKTTIHRYLREIELEEQTTLDDESLLSAGLQEMIAGVAKRLHEEAKGIVKQSEAAYETKLGDLQQQHKTLQSALAEQRKENENLKENATQLMQKHKTLSQQYQDLQLENQKFIQQLKHSSALLDDKASQIQSLEDKHQQAREALSHYRESSKEQREQESRRHAQQVQELQAEQRKLDQTISIKLNELMTVNTDNTRLFIELKESEKQRLSAVSNVEALNLTNQQHITEIATLKRELTNTSAQKEELSSKIDRLDKQLTNANEENKALLQNKISLQTELSVQSRLLENLTGQPNGINTHNKES